MDIYMIDENDPLKSTVSMKNVNTARRNLYLMLSRAFREELNDKSLSELHALQPDIEALATAAKEEHFVPGSKLFKQFVQKAPGSNTGRASLITELRAEFTRRFLTDSAKPSYPCESVYRTAHGLVMQWPWDQVRDTYRSESLLKAGNCPDPEDHISIEFEYMAHLIRKEQSSPASKQAELLSRQNEFLNNHLLTWIPDLCRELTESAPSPFYAALAQLTWGFLNMERELLGNMVSDWLSTTVPWEEVLARTSGSEVWSSYTGGTRALEERSDIKAESAETSVIHSTCSLDCGGQCPLSYHVRNGRIVKVEPHDVGHPELRPCARGLLVQYRVYAPDRLKFPLRRVGKRGEGKFIRISWDEALDEVKNQIIRVRDTYGPASILNLSHSGSTGRLHHQTLSRRFLNLTGGHINRWGGASNQGALFSNLATFGRLDTGNYRDDLLNSRMIILWGCDPARSVFGTETRYYLAKARQKGIRIVSVDPRYTDSTAAFASQWIPILPGTDTAMLVAMAWVILQKGLHDQNFLDKYTIGFDKFRSYVLGDEDGVPKTPEWAAPITGVPADTIRELALDYVTRKPAALLSGFAAGRSAAGEQFHRAASTLAVMSGNVGIAGGAVAGIDLAYRPMGLDESAAGEVAKDYQALYDDIPETPNAVTQSAPPHEYQVGGIRKHTADKVHAAKAWDRILRGKAGGHYSDIRMMYVTNSNCLNQYPDTNKAVEAFNKLEFIVVHDMFLTPTARYADIVLPVATSCERDDMKVPWMFGHYFYFENKAIEPMYQTKTDFQIFIELGDRMGFTFSEKTEDEWLKSFAASKGIPDYEEFKSTGFYQPELPKNYVAFEAQIKDPENNPFPTPSGKIEIFSQRIADFNRPDVIPPVPKYVETWEGVSDPKREDFPLQLLTIHPPNRIHSQLYNVRWLRDMEPHTVWLNPADARARKIREGDQVRVFNDRGTILIPARVTERIIPGVVCVHEGAWYHPDASGIDRGGCANVLTRGMHSPGGAFCSNTALVQIEKA